MKKLLFLFIASCAMVFQAPAQEVWNFDEALIPRYEIPDPFEGIGTAARWEKRREEILLLLQEEMYGYMPSRPEGLHFRVENTDPQALGGKATRKEVKVFPAAGESPGFTMLLYIPNGASGPVPAFLGLNFKGNHTICDDPGITVYDQKKIGPSRSGDVPERGAASSRWPVEEIIGSGYALATIFYEEMALDTEPYGTEIGEIRFSGLMPFGYGVTPWGKPRQDLEQVKKEEHPTGRDWGNIGAWAWGLSRALDYLETDPSVDSRKVAVIGHSRLGKTALWAAAADRRFAMAVSSCSGCSGAAFSRRRIGETLSVVHWFSPEYFKYVDNEDSLPFDQHWLLSLIAPRPVYITSATEDLQADPHGEFLSAKLASPAYALYGKKGLVTAPAGTALAHDGGNVISDAVLSKGYPAPDTPLKEGSIGYHVRTGGHDITAWDWRQILSFADERLK